MKELKPTNKIKLFMDINKSNFAITYTANALIFYGLVPHKCNIIAFCFDRLDWQNYKNFQTKF